MRHSSSVIRHASFVVILVAYLTLAVAYSLADPLYESTDELRHFRYVRHISAYRSLPVQGSGGPRAQSHHPPLYYALGALVSGWVPVEQDVYYSPPTNPYWGYRSWEVSVDNKTQYIHSHDERFPFHGITLAVYMVRWMTVLLGAGVVWLTYRIGRELAPERPALALGGASIVAFNPQFLYLSGAVNNDIPAALCGAAVLLVCVRLVQRGPSVRTDVTFGILYGLALLTKFNLLGLAAPIALAYLIAALPRSQSHADAFNWHALLRGALIIAILTMLIAGWWFWRNYRLYDDPTGMKAVNELWVGRSPNDNWWAIRQKLPYLWSSLWGRFGYGQVPMPQAIYRGLLALSLLALSGHLIPRSDRLPWPSLLLLGATVLAFVLIVFYYILIQPAGAMGRFLFPALPAFATLLSLGISRFFPRRWSWIGEAAIAICMVALSIYALTGVLAPAFARPSPLKEAEIKAAPNPLDVTFGPAASSGEDQQEIARLLGYDVTPTAVQPGEAVDVTLYWETLARPERNYVIFVHLLSEVGTMIAQRDTYPGLGRYPTSAWDPGITFADTYRVPIPETAYAPDVGYIQVGMYLSDGPRLVTADGRDAVRLETVEVRPRSNGFPNPVNVNFGIEEEKIALIGYKLDRRVARPGETMVLTLYWQALAPMETDYRAFAHILGVENQIWANNDTRIIGEAGPTSQWQPGDVITDVRELTVGMTTPSNFYEIELGVYDRDQGRLKVLAENGHQLGDRTFLSKVRVITDE